MQLSTRARYAARAMLELAANYGEGPLQLKEIAKKQEISEKYLEQVLISLRKEGFIHTQKGNRGGYMLAVSPREITLYDVIRSVEGSLAPVACVDNTALCGRSDQCVTRDIWSRLKEKIIAELSSTTLADLVLEQEKKNAQDGSVLYQI
ncbi:MAG: Rrf2 family transcriptional regulator [Bacillota bacterium]